MLLQKCKWKPVFYIDLVYKLENRMIIKQLDITWISCGSLHIWLLTQSRFIAMVSPLIARPTVGQASKTMTAMT